MPSTAFDEVMQGPGHDDPFPVFHRWRTEAPVYPVHPGHWMLTRHADVTSVLRDSRFLVLPAPKIPIPVLKTLFRMFKFLDPPDHKRLRHVVAAPFSPRGVEWVRPFVEAAARELLEGRTEIDVVHDFAEPIPILAVSELLGIPMAKRRKLGRWSHKLLKALDTAPPGNIGDVIRMIRAGEMPPVTSLDAASKLRRYGRRLLRGKVRGTGPSPALEALQQAVADGTITLDDGVATWMVMLVGGMVSTRGFIANSVWALLTNPSELALLRADPSLIPAAVEELLRYAGSGLQVVRVAAEDAAVGDVLVRKGDMVHLMLGAANRDPAAYPDPDRLDVRRAADEKQLAFGTGIHYCPGDAMTRIAAEAALAAIVPRLPSELPAGFTPRWRRSVSVRELKSLPLTLSSPISTAPPPVEIPVAGLGLRSQARSASLATPWITPRASRS